MQTAVVRFRGICTHIQKGSVPESPEVHRVVLADISNPEKYKSFKRLENLPPHVAKLLVARSTILAAEPPIPDSGNDTVSWELHGETITVETNAVSVPPVPPQYPPREDGTTWTPGVPSVNHWAPRPGGGIWPLAPGIRNRAAAILDIRTGILLPVDYDPRSGDAAAEWRIPASRVTVTLERPGVQTQHLELAVPDDTSAPAVPLIQLQNLEVDRGDAPPADFLFHYYVLFDAIPADAKVPTPSDRDEGGTSTGCSNSNYP